MSLKPPSFRSGMQPELCHAGFRGRVSRSPLADAKERRNWAIYADFAHVLIGQARALYAQEPLGVDLEHAACVLDSTVVDLCLGLFRWAHFRKHKAAVKLHTSLDLHGSIPCFICITHAKVHHVTMLDHLPIDPGAFYMVGKACTGFRRLHR